MSDLTTAFWGMTINNYDETDLALVQQGYPDHVRQIVYTLERGEGGTPHIQAYIKLNRQQRLSYVKKLFPRGSFKALTADVYKLHAQRYAQKLDKTAESPAVISNNPFPDPVNELLDVIEAAFRDPDWNPHWDNPAMWAAWQPVTAKVQLQMYYIQRDRVRDNPRLAKFYVSPVYRRVRDEYFDSLKAHVFDRCNPVDTHTHTHTDEKFSHAKDIDDGCSRLSREEEDGCEGEGSCSDSGHEDEGDEDGEGSESETGSESDDSGCSQSDAESED